MKESTSNKYKEVEAKDLKSFLEKNKPWELITENSQNKCFAKFIFQNFSFAFAFLTQVALISEELDHHAELWNIYNTVTIKLYTHETKSITNTDMVFVQKISEIYSRYT